MPIETAESIEHYMSYVHNVFSVRDCTGFILKVVFSGKHTLGALQPNNGKRSENAGSRKLICPSCPTSSLPYIDIPLLDQRAHNNFTPTNTNTSKISEIFLQNLGLNSLPPTIAWNDFPIEPLESVRWLVGVFRNDADKANEALNGLALYVVIALASLHQTNVSAAVVLQDWKRTYGLGVFSRNIPEVEIAIGGHDLSDLYNCIHQTALPLTLNGDGTIGPNFASIYSLNVVNQSQVVMGARKWLLACVQHPDLQVDDKLLGELKILHELPQPHVLPDKTCNYHNQLQARLNGGSGLWPDLTEALKALTTTTDNAWSQTHENDIVSMMKMFLRLLCSVNYAETMNWLWSSKAHFLLSEFVYIQLLKDAFSPMSLKARQVLANTNFLGNWNFSQCFVRQHYSEENAKCSMFLLYRWLMLAATHPDADPSGKIKAVLAKHFDLECLERLPNMRARTYDGGWPNDGRFVWFSISDNAEQEGFETEIKEEEARRVVAARLPSGPRFEVFDYYSSAHFAKDPQSDFSVDKIPWISPLLKSGTHSVSDPGQDAECGICKEDFEDGACIVPNACNHPYHLHCLAKWQARFQQNGNYALTCCFCFKQIVSGEEAKTLDEQLIREREHVPYWQTVEQYEKEKERRAEHAKMVAASAE
jgi:hypothetical protein